MICAHHMHLKREHVPFTVNTCAPLPPPLLACGAAYFPFHCTYSAAEGAYARLSIHVYVLRLARTCLGLQVLTKVIKHGTSGLQLRATDVMLSAIQHDPAPLRQFMRSQKDHELFHILVRYTLIFLQLH